MLYKVGGLLYTDRSRQAIRKCMESLISQNSNKSQPRRATTKPKITDFLQLVKNYNNPPVRLSLFKVEGGDDDDDLGPVKRESVSPPRAEVNELARMRNVLAHSSQILKNLSADENELNKLKISRKLKRKCEREKMACRKKVKHESLSDENYDINTLLSFDKPLTGKDGVDEMAHFPVIAASDAYSFGTMHGGNPVAYDGAIKAEEGQSNMMGGLAYNVYIDDEGAVNGPGYATSETVQLLQTFKDLQNEMCNPVAVNNMQEVYPSQTLLGNSGNVYVDYIPNSANEVGAPNGAEFKENCETGFKVTDTTMTLEETISKNYSLIEEYCKNISTEELLLDNKTDFEFYDGGNSMNDVKLNKNEVIVVNDSIFVNERHLDGSVTGHTVEGLNFDTQLLNSYLSSISGEPSNQNGAEISFSTGQQFDVAQMDAQDQSSISKEHVFEEILKLNKQFQGQYHCN